MASAFKRVLSLLGLLLGAGLLYLFAVWRADAPLEASLLLPFQQPVRVLLPLVGAAVLLYLHAACGLFPVDPGIRFFNWAVFLLSLCAPLCWLLLLHVWQQGLPEAWLLALVTLGAGEGLMGLICLVWAWCQRERALRLLIPASLCQLIGLGLFVACLALGWRG